MPNLKLRSGILWQKEGWFGQKCRTTVHAAIPSLQRTRAPGKSQWNVFDALTRSIKVTPVHSANVPGAAVEAWHKKLAV